MSEKYYVVSESELADLADVYFLGSVDERIDADEACRARPVVYRQGEFDTPDSWWGYKR